MSYIVFASLKQRPTSFICHSYYLGESRIEAVSLTQLTAINSPHYCRCRITTKCFSAAGFGKIDMMQSSREKRNFNTLYKLKCVHYRGLWNERSGCKQVWIECYRRHHQQHIYMEIIGHSQPVVDLGKVITITALFLKGNSLVHTSICYDLLLFRHKGSTKWKFLSSFISPFGIKVS